MESDIVEFIQNRYHSEFDGEAHYTVEEMDTICTEIAVLRIQVATARREAKEACATEIDRLRKELAEARNKALPTGPLLPEVIAAAWGAWHSRHGGKLGPGPAFVEAIEAGIRKLAVLSEGKETET